MVVNLSRLIGLHLEHCIQVFVYLFGVPCDPLAQTPSAGSTGLLHPAQFKIFKSVQWMNFLILIVSVMGINPLGRISLLFILLCGLSTPAHVLGYAFLSHTR